jgi:hypothetical protein
MDWYWYWQILMNEAIAQMLMFSVGLLVIALLLKLTSKKILYSVNIAGFLQKTGEFLAIASTLVSFTALFSSMIERLYTLLAISGFFVIAGLFTAVYIENK